MDNNRFGVLLLMTVVWWVGVDGYKRVCYFTNWSQNRAPRARLFPEQVGDETTNEWLCIYPSVFP